ncbi:hypothetical protein EHF33_05415 [Deinococcus psychrotolerans]|uniref:Uncharacterized protein n=1 Tax=Deinococcus psychrotolerans TaxID=2489213 RepID=A0A3G8YA54_9DEIO|nr:hypothetical protein [Deinococcus psychrotolerans]AZI42259.1 hypothetical protein EHF33_05415 [Deinococcus psychrotolerans]
MRFEFVPILPILRWVYRIPLGPERFQAYLSAVVAGAQNAVEVALPPLVSANPVAREAVLAVLEEWLALGAEDAARAELVVANARFEAIPFPRSVKVGLALLDDLGGGWTNRVINDAARFEVGRTLAKTGWLSIQMWASDAPNLTTLRRLVAEAAHRAVYVAQHGDPLNLAEMLRQEGRVAAAAGRTLTLDLSDLAYSHAVLAPHLASTHQPTCLACFYGDAAAREWGYPPLGLSANAGFEVGLAEALDYGHS